ncbi:glycosyltransferase family 4 protein [Patescibacteria group bacterium]
MNKDKLPVLMFGWELPPHNTGGLGVACYGLAKGLSQEGAKISFALPRKLPTDAPFMDLLSHDLENVKITAINSLLQAYFNKTTYSKLRKASNMQLYGRTIYEEAIRFSEMANEWSERQDHNIIHAHDWMSYPAAMKANKKSGKPWVAHIHATEYDRTGGSVNPVIAETEYAGLNNASRVIAVSNYTKEIVHKKYSIASDKIDVVHNGIDLSEFSPRTIRRLFPNDNIVLFVGRLTFQKGVDYLLKAAQRVLEYQPNTIFLVVGTGDMEQQLIMDSAYMGIGGRVLFPGFITGQKLKDLYQMADVFVMPSVSEPYGIVALESIAAGTPAVISKQSGVAETLSNVMSVDFWDIHKMSSMILSALEYPVFSAEMTRLAREEALKLTWRVAAQKTMRVYNKILS